jgi:hypothetical protein
MAMLPAAGPATYICRCVGLCSEEDKPHLHNLLKGMCSRRSQFDENEYGMVVPLQSGTKSATFKMIKMVPSSPPMVPLGPAQQIM